ncbi:MAG: carboxymuconolactone decarboxylase family protein [Chloroflexota bacterium]
MARIPYPNLQGGDGEFQALVEQIKRERGGRVLNLYSMLLNSPPLAEGWLNLLTSVRYKSSLDGPARELAICEVASITQADYEWRAHARLAKQEGCSDEQLAALPNWRGTQLFDARQQAVLGYAERMTREVQVDDETFAAVRRHFNPRQVLELTVTIGAYNMVSRLLVAMQVDAEA